MIPTLEPYIAAAGHLWANFGVVALFVLVAHFLAIFAKWALTWIGRRQAKYQGGGDPWFI